MNEYIYKVSIIGDCGVGKTTLINTYINGKYDYTPYNLTIGVDFYVKMIKDIKLHIWDLSGDKYYKNIAKRYIDESIGILLVFDLSRKSTFNNLKSWIELIDPDQIKKKQIILIGNKNDKNKLIEKYELNTFILTYGLEYYEINAKENTINGIFKNLVKNIKLKQLNNYNLIGIKKNQYYLLKNDQSLKNDQYANIKYVEETDNKQSLCCCSNV